MENRLSYTIIIALTIFVALYCWLGCSRRKDKHFTGKQYRITYKSKTTGATGHGNWYPDQRLIRELVVGANLGTPELSHWIEEKD